MIYTYKIVIGFSLNEEIKVVAATVNTISHV